MTRPLFIERLLDRDIQAQSANRPQLIETHISWVLISGSLAYKIKKPVKFAFVDFRDLQSRLRYCCEEVRLNRRTAPDWYLGVAPIHQLARGTVRIGATESPAAIAAKSLGKETTDPETDGPIIDWAVVMRAFPSNATLQSTPYAITADLVDAIADQVAALHQQEDGIRHDPLLGAPGEIVQIATDNLDELDALIPRDPRLTRLRRWSTDTMRTLSTFFAERHGNGSIKSCHGDLHLGNIAIFEDKPVLFDCIEFSDRLRCIDVINEVAFLFMDLIAHGHKEMAWRFVNRWCEHTGDYSGLIGLQFYAVYRALVRAKISMHQNKAEHAERYLMLAKDLTQSAPSALLLMHGPSGCGKTFWSQQLLEKRGLIRLRSDVERKRLAGLDPLTRTTGTANAALYGHDTTQRTFHHLLEHAKVLLTHGLSVVVDATFLKSALRQPFLDAGKELEAAVHIVPIRATVEECRARILQRHQRQNDASDADLQVLEQQLKEADPLSVDELRHCVEVKTLL
ncbi:MAG: aminoglycoside phosphotransferase [Burkholderiaceae bacterium]|nr:aminoglycoside phosphotransferase [Burkholderiaceae bacterium]